MEKHTKSKVKTKEMTKPKTSKSKIHIKKRAALMLILLLIVIVVVIVYGIRCLSITLQYRQYTEKMYTYGFAELYNDKKATATDKVTNEEMLKIILAAVSGSKNINELYYSNEIEEEDSWLYFATNLGYTKKITKENLQEKASKIDAVIIATRTVEGILGKELQQPELKMSKSKLAKFTIEEQQVIAKAVSMGIINNKNSSLSSKAMLKGELNKLAVTIIEKYSTIYYKNVSYNEFGQLQVQDVNIVTDVDKMPENYKQYPYIIDSIPNEIYEYDFNIISESNSQSPKTVYKYMGDLYSQIAELLVTHFNKILNVDYKTINTQGFLDEIQGTLTYEIAQDDVKEYVDYVKVNKIQLSGHAEPLLPIIYCNGEQYIVRTKLTFNVLNSNTEYNLLFGDEDHKIKYNGKEITMYVDVPMGMTLNSWSLRANVVCFANSLLENSTSVVVEK